MREKKIRKIEKEMLREVNKRKQFPCGSTSSEAEIISCPLIVGVSASGLIVFYRFDVHTHAHTDPYGFL